MLEPVAGRRARWLFTDRRGGVSTGDYASLNLADHVGDDPQAVSANRGSAASWLGLAAGQVAVMRAAHGAESAFVTGGGVVADVDILVTDRPDVALLALAADCVPMAMADPVAGVVAAVHSGWRGVAAGTARAAVAAMVAAGAHTSRITASLGAAICARCYEVSDAVLAQVTAAAPAAAAVTRTGTPAVDIRAGISEQLRGEGVSDIRVDPACTYEAPTELFSYRRDHTTGRQGVLVALQVGHG
ncbi:MAG: peptidoglycan editing factor PgeF [Actinobacteria bacterium]|nr:peptidoglycan editing factor PgeF [Actinomycetota bacterium]